MYSQLNRPRKSTCLPPKRATSHKTWPWKSGELAQRLEEHSAPTEDPSSIPSIHSVTHNCLGLQTQGDLILLACKDTCTCMRTHTHIHTVLRRILSTNVSVIWLSHKGSVSRIYNSICNSSVRRQIIQMRTGKRLKQTSLQRREQASERAAEDHREKCSASGFSKSTRQPGRGTGSQP